MALFWIPAFAGMTATRLILSFPRKRESRRLNTFIEMLQPPDIEQIQRKNYNVIRKTTFTGLNPSRQISLKLQEIS